MTEVTRERWEHMAAVRSGRRMRLRVAASVLLTLAISGGVVQAEAASSRHLGPTVSATHTPTIPPITPIPTSGPGIDPSPGVAGVAVNFGANETLGDKTLTVVKVPKVSLYVYPTKVNTGTSTISYAWVISDPTPADGEPPPSISFGQFPVITVTTLAFGAIPVSVQVHLSQPVGANGLVEPLTIVNGSVDQNFALSGQLAVSLSDLSIDGVDLHLNAACSTVTPAHLVAYATAAQYQLFVGGGVFTGQVSIPDFKNCLGTAGTTPAENLDDLFDGTLSGATNPSFLSAIGLGGYNPAKKGDCGQTPLYINGAACLVPLPSLPVITGPTVVPPVNPSDYPTPIN